MAGNFFNLGLAGLFFFSVGPLFGAVLGEEALSLARCLELAREVSPTLEVARERTRRADLALGDAWAEMFPTATLNGSYRSSGSWGVGDRNWSGSASWNLFNLGRDWREIGIAKRSLKSQEETLREAFLDLHLSVVRAFFSVLSSKQTLTVRKRDLMVSRENLELTTNLYEDGVVGYPEVLNAELQLQGSLRNTVRARTADDSARLALNVLLDREPLARLKLLPPPFEERELAPLKEILKEAFLHRPDWKSSTLDLRSAQVRRKLALLDVFPNLKADLSLAQDLNADSTTPNPSWSVDLTLSVPLFDGFSNYRDFRAAEVALRIERAERVSLARTIRTEVTQAYLRLKENKDLRKINEKEVLAAKQRLLLITQLFKEGNSSSEFLQRAQDRVLTAKTQEVSLRFNTWVLEESLANTIGRGGHERTK